MALYVYSQGPIDFWGGWMTFAQATGENQPQANAWELLDAGELEDMWATAQVLARNVGWEGDVSQGPYVAGFPDPERDPGFIIGWKQGNNGITFIASRHALPHLEQAGAAVIRR